MKQCPKCETEHNNNGKFCSRKCANSRVQTDAIRLKKSIAAKNSEKIKSWIKIKYCKYCGNVKGQCRRSDICNKYQTFPRLIQYFGLNKEIIGTEKLYEEFDKIKLLLVEDYITNELSTTEIAAKYKYPYEHIFCLILKSFGIKRRTLSESQQIKLKNGTHSTFLPKLSKYKTGWHTTWNGKSFFLRSSYELDYAQKLDKEQVDYEVEKLRILYFDSRLMRQRVAIPDFYLPATNTIIEIKSGYTLNKQEMKDKFKVYKEHGYNCKLILDKEEIDLIV
jgi:hypothetical protein